MDLFDERNDFYKKIEKQIELSYANDGVLDLSDFYNLASFPKGIFKGVTATTLKIASSPPNQRMRHIIDAEELNFLHNLEVINIRRANFKNLYFGAFPYLKNLTLNSSNVQELPGIEDCAELEELLVTFSGIKKATMLRDLGQLKRVNLNYSQISNIEDMGYLPNLTSLDVSRTNVSDIPYIMQFPKFADSTAENLGFRDTPSALINNPMRLLSGMRGRDCVKQTIMYLKGEHPDLRDFSGIKQNIESLLSEASPVEVTTKSGKISVDNVGPAERINPVEQRERLLALKAHIEILIAETAYVQCPQPVIRRLKALLHVFESDTPIFLILETHAHFLNATVEDNFIAEMMDAPLLCSIKKLVSSVQQLKPFMMPPPDQEAVALAKIPEIRSGVSAEDFLDVARQTQNMLSSEDIREDIGVSVIETIESFKENLGDQTFNNRPSVFKNIAARFSGFISLLSNAASIHAWISTYAAGLNIINQLQNLLNKLISFFVG